MKRAGFGVNTGGFIRISPPGRVWRQAGRVWRLAGRVWRQARIKQMGDVCIEEEVELRTTFPPLVINKHPIALSAPRPVFRLSFSFRRCICGLTRRCAMPTPPPFFITSCICSIVFNISTGDIQIRNLFNYSSFWAFSKTAHSLGNTMTLL